ncbi:hypothetical protein PENDEC_c061G02253, partial [Penicillium decumbens]
FIPKYAVRYLYYTRRDIKKATSKGTTIRNVVEKVFIIDSDKDIEVNKAPTEDNEDNKDNK